MSLRFPLLSFFVLAYAISWLIWAPLWLPALGFDGLPVLPFHHALGSIGPLAAAFIMSGRAGSAELLRRMFLFRGRVSWVLVALLLPFAILAIGLLAAYLFGGEVLSLDKVGVTTEFSQFNALEFLLYNIVVFGFGEETGWRGYALPRLQARHSALVASLILTICWAAWHLPLFLYRPGYAGMGLAAAAGWLISLVTGSVITTWLYNTSRGSILVVAVLHATIDIAFTSANSSPIVVNAAGFLITVLGVGLIVAYGPRTLSPAGKMIWNGTGQEIQPAEGGARAP